MGIIRHFPRATFTHKQLVYSLQTCANSKPPFAKTVATDLQYQTNIGVHYLFVCSPLVSPFQGVCLIPNA